MNSKKVNRCTGAQIRHIIDYMGRNLKFVYGKNMSVVERRAHWFRLRDILKSYGPDKSIDQWQHTWRDMKNRAHKSSAAYKRALEENISLPEPFFSEQTVKILEIIENANSEGTDSQTDGGIGDEINPDRESVSKSDVEMRKETTDSAGILTEMSLQVKACKMRALYASKKIRCTGAQMRRLIEHMTANPQFARKAKAISPIDQKQFMKQWARLAKKLNACGPEKTVQQWRFTWRDLKKRARIESAARSRAIEEGRNPDPLSNKIEMVLKVMHAAQSEDTGQSESRIDDEVKTVGEEEESYECDDEGANDNTDEQPGSCVGDEIAISFKEEVLNYTTDTLEDANLTVPYDNSTDPLTLTGSLYNSQPYTTYEDATHEPHATHSSNDPPTPLATVTSNTEPVSTQARLRIRKTGRTKRKSIQNILQSINESLIDVNKLSAEMLRTQSSIAEAERDSMRIAAVQLRRQHADSRAVPYSECFKTARPKGCQCRLCQPEDFINRPSESTEPTPEYQCPVCLKVFPTRKAMMQHKYNSHKSKEVYEFCEPCNKWIQHRKFNNHLKTSAKHVKEEDSVLCEECNKRVYKPYLDSHMRRNHVRTEYCKTCDKWFTKSVYKAHLAKNLRHVSKDHYKFTCELCNGKYVCLRDIDRHMQVVHLKMLPYKCPHCKSAFKSLAMLRKHVLTIHEKKSVPKNFICHICGSAWETSGLLKNHMVVHTGERRHKCKVCDATFGHSGALYTHNKLKHLKEKSPTKQKRNPTKKKQNPTKKKMNTRSANKKVQNTEQE